MYADKCTESQVCNDCTYRQNSVSEVLSNMSGQTCSSVLRSWIHIPNCFIYRVFCMRENLLNIFIVQYHTDLLIFFLVENCYTLSPCYTISPFSTQQARITSPPCEVKELWITHDRTRPYHSACELLHMHLFLPKTGCCLNSNFVKKETLAQVFSCEYREIFKNTFFTEHLCAATKGNT